MKRFAEYQRQGRVVFFVDSSISSLPPTLLPNADKFITMLLEAMGSVSPLLGKLQKQLGVHDFSVKEISKIIYAQAGASYCQALNLFSFSPPNSLHRLLATLLRERKLPLLVSASIDNCLKQALLEQHLVEGHDFTVIADNYAYQNWQPSSDKISLFKLAGSLDSETSIVEVFNAYQDGIQSAKVDVLHYIFKKYYVVFVGLAGISPYIHTFTLETLPCSSPGLSLVCKNQALLAGIKKVIAYYDHDIEIIEESTENFIREFCREVGVEDTWEQPETTNNYEKQFAFLKKWANEVGPLLCHEIFAALSERARKYDLALQCREQALAIAKSQMNAYNLSRVYNGLGNYYTMQQETAMALQNFEKSVQILQKLKQLQQLAGTYDNLGELYFQQQQWELSLNHYRRALEIYQQQQDSDNLAATYNKMGNVYEKQLDFGRALECYEKSLDYHSQKKDNARAGKIYNQLGRIYFKKREIKAAQENFYQAQEIAWNCGDMETVARVYTNLAVLAHYEKAHFQAEKLYKRAALIFEQLKEKEGAAAVYYNLGLLKYSNEDSENAIHYLHKAMHLLDSKSTPQEYQRVLDILAEITGEEHRPKINL